MNVLKSYFNGLKTAWNSKRMTALLYILLLIFSFVVVIPFFGILKKETGFSMSVYPLLKDFDLTVYSDFIQHSGKAIKPFVSIGIWLSVFYLFFGVFLSGGIIHIIYDEENNFSLKEFFAGCGNYVLPFFRLTFFSFLVQAVIALIIYVPLFAYLDSLSETAESEITLVYTFITGAAIHLILAAIVMLITDYAKIMMVVNESRKAFVSFWLSFKFFLKYFFKVIFLYILLLVFPVLALIAYFIFSQHFTIVSKSSFLIVVTVQQVFVLFRLWFKIWFYGSEISFLTETLGIKRKPATEEVWDVHALEVSEEEIEIDPDEL